MRRIRIIIVLAFAVLLSGSPGAWAAKRVALVIGNSAYQHTPRLANPEHDAKLIASTLSKHGFEVLERTNLSYKAMKRALQEFTARLEHHGKDAVGFLFYAGHGVQVAGDNYLIPVDAKIEHVSHVDIEGIDSASIMAALSRAANRLNIIVLDACRDNPYRSKFRSAARGLARMEAPTGSLIAYSTAPGGVAADGDGSNSPYSAALAQFLAEPGLKIEDVFKRVRERVYASTGGQQTPWESSSIFGDFYVAPRTESTEANPALEADRERALWDAIRNSDRLGDFEAYLKGYPDGAFVPLAKSRIAALQPAQQSEPAIAQREKQPEQLLEGAALVTALQKELRRVGCDPGPIDGKWGAQTRQALETFRSLSNSRIGSNEPAFEALSALNATIGRVCPDRSHEKPSSEPVQRYGYGGVPWNQSMTCCARYKRWSGATMNCQNEVRTRNYCEINRILGVR